MKRWRNHMRIATCFVLLAALVPTLAEASSTTNTKVNRIRTGQDGRTYINLVAAPGTPSCPPGLAAEDFYFFSNTPTGRVLYAQVLAAYTTGAVVDVFGDGTCYTPSGFAQWEQVSSFVLHP